MRQVIVKAFGGPEQLTLESTDEGPAPGPGQVLVAVEAAGVNYIDVMQRKGIAKVPLPYTPGVINYGRDYAFLDELLSLTDGRAVHLAFDAIGSATLASTLKGLARGGTVVSFGSASGPPPAIDPRELINPCTRVAGGSVFSYVAEPAELQGRGAAVVDAIRAGWLNVGNGTAYYLREAASAHRDIEGRRTQGKLYLTP